MLISMWIPKCEVSTLSRIGLKQITQRIKTNVDSHQTNMSPVITYRIKILKQDPP